MKDLNTLWERYKKAESKIRTNGTAYGRVENPQQQSASTRAFNKFLKELKKQRGYNDTEATNSIISEWS